jgi:hypothetical protein
MHEMSTLWMDSRYQEAGTRYDTGEVDYDRANLSRLERLPAIQSDDGEGTSKSAAQFERDWSLYHRSRLCRCVRGHGFHHPVTREAAACAPP